MNIRKEENNGVTLIALVVTILTLLILSLVAVLTLSGESGILAQIERAGIETELDNISEKINIMAMQNNVDIIFDKAEADTITYLQKEGVLDTNNKVNTELLLGRKTKYGEIQLILKKFVNRSWNPTDKLKKFLLCMQF